MKVTELKKGPMRMFAARTGAKDVVAIEGSVLGGYHMLGRDMDMVPRLATALMDAGTKNMTREFIRSALSQRGASISFSPGGDRTYFHASCLPEDIDFVLKLIVECLSNATFPAHEIALQKKRTLAEFEELKTKTLALARQEFSRTVYDRNHANYSDPIPVSEKRISEANRADFLAYRKLLGQGGLVLAITGDIAPKEVLAKAERAFRALPKGTEQMTEKSVNTISPQAVEKRIPIADKANIDVIMGTRTPFTYNSPEFLAFMMFSSMLGGRGLATGHLMRTIRERDGLTYGIYANPVGFEGLADGAFQIWATFSPATYAKAVAATKKEIGVFLSSGITEKALATKKVELVGRYAIGLGTSGGLASTLHQIGIEEKPLSYMDEYPRLLNAVTVSDLHKVQSLIPFDKLAVVAAGTFEKKG